MKRFVEGEDSSQGILVPECLDDTMVADDNPVRVIDVLDELHLRGLGFEGVLPATLVRPS